MRFSSILIFLLLGLFLGRIEAQVVRLDSLYSKSCKQYLPYHLIIPKSYIEDAKEFKLLYVLHGADGGHYDYLKRTQIVKYANDYALIIVLPSAVIHQDGKKITNTWYVNSPKLSQVQWESYFLELDSVLHQQFDVEAHSGIMGLSMGGYGAAYLATVFPEKFATMSTLSGLFRLDSIKKFGIPEVFGDRRYDPRYHLFKQVSKLKQIDVLLSCGTEDKFYLDHQNPDFYKSLKHSRIDVTSDFTTGNHSWQYWDATLPKHLKFHSYE